MTALLRQLIALVLRIFFRRIAIVGAERVPATGPVLLVLNHPNSLVDPLFLLGLAPRRVVFLAKEPLFRMPVIGTLVRAVGSIPVYRRQDAADMSHNRETFQRVWEELDRGGAVALFPEGTSHSDPRLRPLKTGAARLALGAAAVSADGRPVTIVPAGLYYTAKARFRSSALLYFGVPIAVPSAALGADGEPAPDAVRELTAHIRTSLDEVTLQADEHEALALITRAERIFSSGGDAVRRTNELEAQFGLRRRFLAGYAELRRRSPERLESAIELLARYEAELAEAGLPPEAIAPGPIDPWRVVKYTVRMLAYFIFVLPVAAVGIAVHFPAYVVTGPFAMRVVHGERDVVATAKILSSCLLYPLTWALVGWAAAAKLGAAGGPLVLVALPLSGMVALRFLERLDRFIGAARGLTLLWFRPSAFRRLVADRQKIRDAILKLAEGLQ